jgi:hypothetical protein
LGLLVYCLRDSYGYITQQDAPHRDNSSEILCDVMSAVVPRNSKCTEDNVFYLRSVDSSVEHRSEVRLLFLFQQMGVALGARARIQLNLAVSQVVDIKQVATFPDIVFPIMWFEDVRIHRYRKLHLATTFKLLLQYQPLLPQTTRYFVSNLCLNCSIVFAACFRILRTRTPFGMFGSCSCLQF